MTRQVPKFLIALIVLALFAALLAQFQSLRAQTEPTNIIDAAYRDLSQKLGKPIARGGDSSFTWEQTAFPDSSLGCPKPGQAYSQIVTSGYKIVITFQGSDYDYRATTDGKTLFLCTATGGVAITQTPQPSVATPTVATGSTGGTTTTSLANTLAFIDRSGNVEIVRPGESAASRITSNAIRQDQQNFPLVQFNHVYGQFRWSPDGSKLLFTDLINETLFVAISGQAPVQVATGLTPLFPGAWSPDGTKIAYPVSTNQQQPPNGLVQQVQSVTLTGTTVSAPVFAGSFSFGVGCGGAVLDPADVLYTNEAGYGFNGITFVWTTQGFVHSTACNGVGLALTDANGKDVWSVPTLARAAVSPDRSKAVGIGLAQNGTNNTSLSLIDLATGNQTPVGTQPGPQQVAWSADGANILYSTLAQSAKVSGNADSAVGKQLFPMWPVDAISNTVTLWREPAAGGQSTQLFQRDGRAIGVISPVPDNSGVAISFISPSTDMVQQINNGAAVPQALLVQPHVTLFFVSWDGSAQPTIITEGGQPSFSSGSFTAQAGVSSTAEPTIAPTPNLAPPALSVGGRAVVTTTQRDTLNLRQTPGLAAKVVRILKPGALVTIVGGPATVDSLRWWQVRTDDGVLGWVVDQVTDQNGTVNMLMPQ